MTRRSDQVWERECAEADLAPGERKQLQSLFNELEAAGMGRRPGMFQRVTLFGLQRLGLLFTVSLVGWLLFLACLALMLLPGCSSTDFAARESAAFRATEQLIVHNLSELEAGRMSSADFASGLRLALDNLQAAEQGERSNASTGWLEVAGTALGSSTIVGGLMHVARNATRKRDLGNLVERLDALEKDGAA